MLNRTFINPRTEELRATWKVLLFLSIWLGLNISQWLNPPPAPSQVNEAALYWVFLISLFILIPVALGESALCARLLEQRSLNSVGIALHQGWWRDLGLGWLIGAIMIAAVALIQLTTRQANFHFPALTLVALVTMFLKGAVLYLLAAFYEELILRGFPLQALLRDHKAWVGIGVTALVFAVFHNANPAFSWLAFFNTFLAGIWLAIAYIKTRSLWLATGLHTGWNFAMGVLFGYSVSGNPKLTESVLRANAYGNHWITGGGYGPEGGLIVTLIVVLATIWLWRTTLFQPTPEMLKLTDWSINQPAHIQSDSSTL